MTQMGTIALMENAPIHTHENIKKYREYRAYQCVYFLAYSPVNLIQSNNFEQW